MSNYDRYTYAKQILKIKNSDDSLKYLSDASFLDDTITRNVDRLSQPTFSPGVFYKQSDALSKGEAGNN